MPRRNRRSGRGAAGRMVQRVEQQLMPYPVGFVPPRDPPTIRRNKIVRGLVDVEATADSSGIDNFSSGSFRNRIKSHFGLDSPCFVLEEIMVWGDITGTFQDLSLVDYQTGVQVYDEGSLAVRPRCGLRYPKAAQVVFTPATDTVICSVLSKKIEGKTWNIAMRILVRAWDSLPVTVGHTTPWTQPRGSLYPSLAHLS